MIGCLTETTTCVVAKPLVNFKEVTSSYFFIRYINFTSPPFLKIQGCRNEWRERSTSDLLWTHKWFLTGTICRVLYHSFPRANIVKGYIIHILISLYKSACLSVNESVCLSMNPSELKFWGMIPLGIRKVLGQKKILIRQTVSRKIKKMSVYKRHLAFSKTSERRVARSGGTLCVVAKPLV